MANTFSFNQDHTISVEVSHDDLGKIGSANLTFGPKKAISLQFSSRTIAKLEEEKKYDRLTAISQNGRVFTLFNCELHFTSIYADYVVAGDTANAFNLVEFEITHVSEWFFQWQQIVGDVGASIEWKNRPSEISANVASPLGNFCLAITPHSNLIATSDGYEIRDSAIVSINHSQCDFTVNDIRSITTSLCALFSILFGLPVSVLSVSVRGKNSKDYSLYFPHYEKIEEAESDLKNGMRFLLKRRLLDKDGTWQSIAQSFFNSDLRDPSWIRLSSMKRYQDFWEYKVAAYVFILDSYVDFKTKSLPKKIKSKTNKLNEFENKLAKSNSSLSPQQFNTLIDLATSIFGSTDHSFREKYQHIVSTVDADVIEIINLTDENFKVLKDFRDDIAHGDRIRVSSALSTKIPQLTEKLSLLLTYFAFLDFGLTSSDFIECISHTFNRMVRNSEINEAHLSRVIKDAEFIEVSSETLDLFEKKTKKKVFCCFEVNPNEEPKFSEYHTDLYTKQLSTKKSSHSQDPNDVFQLKDRKVRTVGRLYFEHGGNRLLLHHVFLFERL